MDHLDYLLYTLTYYYLNYTKLVGGCVMSIISVRLSDKLLREVDAIACFLDLARAEYIRKAIEHMNEETLSLKRKQHLINASLKVRNESMKVNAEFSRVEHDPKA
jgi:metal-responsive CopG/Arc/MetJ family transcriptional regulator